MLVWGIDTPSHKLKNPYNYSIIFVITAQNKIVCITIYLLKMQYKNTVFKNIQKFEFVFVNLYRFLSNGIYHIRNSIFCIIIKYDCIKKAAISQAAKTNTQLFIYTKNFRNNHRLFVLC